MVDVKVDRETLFQGESMIEQLKKSKFYFGNTGSDQKSADVAVSNFEFAAITPKPFKGLPQIFRVQEYGHALDIVRIPSTKTKWSFEIEVLYPKNDSPNH